LSGVRPDDRGEPLAAAEIVVVINLFRQGGEEQTNVSVRGLSPSSFDLRPKIQMTEGRMFQQGLREVIIGKGISTRFQNTKLGDVLRFGKADWTVVGLFDAGGTAFDSEIWCDVNQLASDYNRDSYSSVLLRASSASAVGEIISRIQDDRRYDIAAQPEIAYYEEQTATAAPIRAIGFFVAIVMGIGACFAAANTMYAAVAYRTREIATLRILGFKRGSILLSFMIESLTLALIGGVLGCVLALPINGITGGTANWQTFSEIAFAFRVTPGLVGIGMGFALLMGLFGGFFPARRASKQEPAGAMREV
jgi:putative ABC transport system permease protein